ncbi:MAG: chitobiase/beta-hexosaminidase C-terminal domain-containing protein [Planctomycetota bacterium]
MPDASQTAPTRERDSLRRIVSRGMLIMGLALAAGLPGGGSAGAMTPTQRDALMRVDARGGRVLEVPHFDLSSGNALWQNQPHAYFDFSPASDQDLGYWFLVAEPPSDRWLARTLWTERNVEIKPNRRYLLSALVRTDFDRFDAEFNLGLQALDRLGNPLPGRRDVGLPAKTRGPDGWQRFEAVVTTPPDRAIVMGRPTFAVYLGEGVENPAGLTYQLADLAIVELPAVPFGADDDPVEAVTFPGGPGPLPMAVEAVRETDGGAITVEVTGVRWVIDPENDTITAHQRIDFSRPLASWAFGISLRGLEVRRQDATVAVLVNDQVALGVQCDGMLAVYPRAAGSVTVTSRIQAPFTRFGDGHLLATDGRGGFGTNPYPPPGSGRLPDGVALTNGLDFVGFDRADLESLSEAPAGWRIRWNLEPAERLFLYAAPPRAYDWAASFDLVYQLTDRNWTQDAYADDAMDPVGTFLLWHFHARQWGMSFGDEYLPFDADAIRRHVRYAHTLGKKAIFYSSAWFFASREPEVWTRAVIDEVEEFGFDGFYSDGLPAVEWLVGYEQMRIARQALGDKLIVVHDSVPQSGRHPAALAPWIYTYATATYMAEHVESRAGAGWPWVRYVIGQHRFANCIGTIKGDRWDGPAFDDAMDRFNAGLIWNARRAEAAGPKFNRDYLPNLRALETRWLEHRDDPHYYDRYHVEAARQLSGFRVGPTAMPVISRDPEGRVVIRSETPDAVVHFTTDGSAPGTSSRRYDGPLPASASGSVRAVAAAPGLEASPPTPPIE